MTRNPDEELSYYANRFKTIRNKKYEFFVISRIIHLLNDNEIEFTTQQLIRTKQGRFLLDLYFPQFKLAIEVDEPYHARDHQIGRDEKKDKAVVERSQVKIERIRISGLTFADVKSRIDDVIQQIQREKAALKKTSKFVPFVFGQKSNTDYWLRRGKTEGLSLYDDARFRRHIDVARLFGKQYKGHQRAEIKIDESSSVWFPKLYPNGEWDNELSPDGKKIEMKKVRGGKFNSKTSSKKHEKVQIYVFAHHRDEFGNIYYAFKGVFIVTQDLGNRKTFTRHFNAFHFNGKGWIEPFNQSR